MSLIRRSPPPIRRSHVAAVMTLVVVLALAMALASGAAGQPRGAGGTGPVAGKAPAGGPATPSVTPADGAPARVAPGALEFRFTDDRKVQLKLRDDRIAIVTPYGRLQVPVADIRWV